MYAWSTPVIDSPRQVLASTSIPTEENGWAGSNSVGFIDKTFDELIFRSETELDPQVQKDVWARMQEIYARKLPALPLFFRAEPHVIPPWLAGYAPTGHNDYAPEWAEFWRAQ